MAFDMSRLVASAIEAALEDKDEQPRRSRHTGVKAVAAGAALAAAAGVAVKQAPKLSGVGALTTLGKVTRVPDMVRDIPDRVREELADRGWIEDEDAYLPDDTAGEDDELEEDEDLDGDEEPEEEPEAEGDLEDDEEPADEEEPGEDEGPEDEGDEGPEGEGDDGPEDEGGDEWPDAEYDGGDDDVPGPEEDEELDADEPEESASVDRTPPGLEVDANGDSASVRGAAPDVIGVLSQHKPPPVLRKAKRTKRLDPVARPPKPPTADAETSGNGRTKSGKSASTRKSGSTAKSRSTTKSGSKSKSGSKRAKAGSR